jgi:hypothetical protein
MSFKGLLARVIERVTGRYDVIWGPFRKIVDDPSNQYCLEEMFRQLQRQGRISRPEYAAMINALMRRVGKPAE